MAILLLMLALAGQVFNLTVQSTGQATALTDVMQQLRVFEQTLRDDLRHVQPGNSLILIQGNPVNAYWTAAGRDADDDATVIDGGGPQTGYPHPADPERDDLTGKLVPPRADVLMVFTSQPGKSFAQAGQGVSSNIQQVVYGHAELGEYVANDPTVGGYTFQPLLGTLSGNDLSNPVYPVENLGGAPYPSTTKVSQVPAENWHLARRSVLLVSAVPPTTAAGTTPVSRLDDVRLLRGERDVIYAQHMPGPKLPPNNGYTDLVLRPQPDPTTGDPMGAPWYLPAIFGNVSQQYKDWIKPFARSLLDPSPPPVLASRLGHYMLPNCASFKVEWMLNPRSEFVAGRLDGTSEVFWFDPGDEVPPGSTATRDPLRSLAERVVQLKDGSAACKEGNTLCRALDTLLTQRSYHPDAFPTAYSLSDRFRGPAFPGSMPEWETLAPDGRRPNLVVFTGTRPAPVFGEEPAPDDMFPGALRVTVDVYDKDRRLDRPLRHVMVIPIGG